MSLLDSLSVAATPELLLGRDAACAVFCAVAAKFWVSFWSELAAADRIDSKISRKLIHTGSAPLFMMCWPLFSDAPTARLLASAVPFIQIIRLYRAGQATLPNAPTDRPGNEAALVKAISRSGERGEALGGPFLYTLVLFTATALGWRTPAAAVALCQMAVGDGIADIFGRRFGKIKWPFSKK
jgi:dolichol kinase